MILPIFIARSISPRDNDQQGSPVITQIITQPAVTQPAQTLTTLVTLGSSPTPTQQASHHDANPGLTNVQVGAIIGSIAALVVIGIAAGICLSAGRRTEPPHKYYTTTSKSSSSSGSSRARRKRRRPRPTPPPPVTEWVPGGPKFPTYKAIPITRPPVAQTK